AAIQETEALAGADEVELGSTAATLPDGETTIRGELLVTGPGSIRRVTERDHPVLASRTTGRLRIEGAEIGCVTLTAHATLEVVGCELTWVSVQPGGVASIEDSRLPGSDPPWSMPPWIDVQGGRLDVTHVRAATDD